MRKRFERNLLDKISLMRQQDSSGNNGMELSGSLPSLLERSEIDDPHIFVAQFSNLSDFIRLQYIDRILNYTSGRQNCNIYRILSKFDRK